MNWFAFQPTAESLLQNGVLFLAVVSALLAIITIFTLVLLLYTMLAVRSSDSHLESHQFGTAKRHIDHSTVTPQGALAGGTSGTELSSC